MSTAQVVKLAEHYFGPIKRVPAVRAQHLLEPVLATDRYVSYEDNIRLPMLQMVFPTVPHGHPDELALNALAAIIGDGNTSLLYQNLVQRQLAVQALAYQENAELGGEFTLRARVLPTMRLDSTEAIFRKTLTQFGQNGPSDEDLARFKGSAEAQLVDYVSSLWNRVDQLAEDQTLLHDSNHLPKQVNALRALTTADVRRVYNQYIKNKHAVILSVVPKGKANEVAATNNYTASAVGYVAPDYGYAGLTYTKATDTFDRSRQPAAGPLPLLKGLTIWQDKFGNGLQLIGTRNPEFPTTTLLLTLEGGRRLEPLAKAGLANLTAALLNEGSEHYTSEELTAALDRLGSTIQVACGNDNTTVAVRSLTRNLPATLALLDQRLLHPRFDPGDFDRLKQRTLQDIANQITQPAVVADNAYARLLYGPSDIMSVPVEGTTASVTSLTLDDVKQFYQRAYSPNVSFLAVVSDQDQTALEAGLGFLRSWLTQAITLPVAQATPQPEKTKIYFIDKPGAPQSEIRVGYLSPLLYDATGDYYRAYLSNYLLGEPANFNARLNLNLRQNKGYTYGATSTYQGSRYPGPYTAQAGGRADATAASVQEFMKELQTYRSGISDTELTFLQGAVSQIDTRSYETIDQKVRLLARLVEYHLPPNYLAQQHELLKKLTKADIQASAQQ